MLNKIKKRECKMILSIKTLGELRLTYGIKTIDSSQKRSKLLWVLLAFLIVNIDRTPSLDEICEVLWDQKEINDPVHAVKNIVYRLRNLIKKELGADKDEYIIASCGSYCWNKNAQFEIDTDKFYNHINIIKNTSLPYNEAKIDYKNFITKYNAKYLPLIEPFNYFIAYRLAIKNKFIETVLFICSKALENKDYVMLKLSASVILSDDYFNEDAHWYYMNALILERSNDALAEHYNRYELALIQELMEKPSERIVKLYSHGIKKGDKYCFTLSTLIEDISEKSSDGAMLLSFNSFKEVYRLILRQLERNKHLCYLILLLVYDNE